MIEFEGGGRTRTPGRQAEPVEWEGPQGKRILEIPNGFFFNQPLTETAPDQFSNLKIRRALPSAISFAAVGDS